MLTSSAALLRLRSSSATTAAPGRQILQYLNLSTDTGTIRPPSEFQTSLDHEQKREESGDKGNPENKASVDAGEVFRRRNARGEKGRNYAGEKERVLRAALGHVLTLGWGESAMMAGARDVGISPAIVGSFERKEAALVEFLMDDCLQRLMDKIDSGEDLGNWILSKRISKVIRIRLEMQAPYISKWPEALSIQAQPMNLPTSFKQRAELVDEFWHAIGDQGSDMDWYVKRTILGGIYSTSELFMLTDKSPDLSETWSFVNNRVKDAFDLQKTVPGGVTTLIDMPLNSFPSTVSEQTLRLKIEAARDKLYVDVGFWGGLVPENAFNQTVLEKLLDAGALGLKSFMCPSGINDFPMTNATHIKEGLYVLAKYKRPLLVHSEIQLDSDDDSDETNDDVSDPRSYSTYLKTRPPSWEEAAIKELHNVAYDTRIGGRAEGAHLHIVHLSDSQASLNIIKDAKAIGASVTVETCPHYLAFSSEQIPYGDTRFKCSPPIRDEVNRMNLWHALMDGHIDLLSSDHSPSLPELKLLDEGDFLKAWGGISSLQFVLPITWSYGKKFGITLNQLAKWWSEGPAKLSGQELKGAIVSGSHADLVIWDPDIEYELDENYGVHHKHRNISAYMGTKLFGKVVSTFVRGSLVYSNGEHAALACRDPILAT